MEVMPIEFVGHAVVLDAEFMEFGLELRVSAPFTTTQLPMGGYEEGRFCKA